MAAVAAVGSVLGAGGLVSLAAPAHAADGSVTFDTPGVYSWWVPDGVTSIQVRVAGAAGGGSDYLPRLGTPGHGDIVTATLPVAPGDWMTVTVGSKGGIGADAGWPGGGRGAIVEDSDVTDLSMDGGAGGGYSSIDTYGQDLILAGGGGGAAAPGLAGGDAGLDGGHGAHTDEQDGRPGGAGQGQAGTAGAASNSYATCLDPTDPTRLGDMAFGESGTAGSSHQGGAGGHGVRAGGSGGGGGGGGYIGGGGGGAGALCLSQHTIGAAGAGGGGSDFFTGQATLTTAIPGGGTGDGSVVISYATQATGGPQAAPTFSPDSNDRGWWNSAPTVNWNWTPGAGGTALDPAHCQRATGGGDVDGTKVVSATCQDVNGVVTKATARVWIDETAPTSDVKVTPKPNANGWVTKPPHIDYGWSDAMSDITFGCTLGYDDTGAAQGLFTRASGCDDEAGNHAEARVSYGLDMQAPTDAPVVQQTSTGVAVDWNWEDQLGLSGIDTHGCVQTSTSPRTTDVTLTSTCRDLAGNVKTDSITVNPDKTAPTANPEVVPNPNAAGWNRGRVAVNWSWKDDVSGIDPNACTVSSPSSEEGIQTVSATCSDRDGNQGNASATVKIDSTKPVAAPKVTRSVSGVSVDWNWSDAVSGVDPAVCQQATSKTGTGMLTLSSSCTDVAGNTATDKVTVDNHQDVTGPSDARVVSPAANAAGWNNTNVSVAWNWTDADSGVDSANCTQQSTSSGEGVQTLSASCSDLAGNASSDSVQVKVDKTKPVDAPVVTTTATGASVAWNWSDGLSGVDAPSCTQSSSQTGKGQLTLTSSCTDKAGNTATDSKTVTVAAPSTKADLQVKVTGPASGKKYTAYSYTVTVKNAGPGVAKNLASTLLLPNKATLVSDSGSPVKVGQLLTWTKASLASGSSVSYTVTLKFPSTGTWSLGAGTASVRKGTESATPDPNLLNNLAAVVTKIT